MEESDFREHVFSKLPPADSRPLLERVIGAFVAGGSMSSGISHRVFSS